MKIPRIIFLQCCFFQQSLTAPYAELAGFVGADWPDFTRYLEYQDGSFMTDGTYNDKSGFLFKSLYGAGEPRTCFQLGLNGNIEGCGGSGAVLCEITLDKDTHVCLNNDFLSTVTLNSSTELTVSTNTISSPLCIEYCRGSAQQHKYVLIDEDKCTCATGKSLSEALPFAEHGENHGRSSFNRETLLYCFCIKTLTTIGRTCCEQKLL